MSNEATRIDRFNPTLTKQNGIVPVAGMKQTGSGRFVRYEDHVAALSRQSAVGGDWDGDAALLDTLLYAQSHGISNHAHSPGTPPTDILDDYEQSIPKESYYRQSLRVIRRALRCATRTPEGEGGDDQYRGHRIEKLDGSWYYAGTDDLVSEGKDRPCGYCDLANTPEGHDGCLGTLPGVMNACCGHGNPDEAYVQYDNGDRIGGVEALYAVLQMKVKNNIPTHHGEQPGH